MSNQNDNCGAGIAVISFLAGAVMGAAIALLTAPRSGRETREMLSEYGDELREKARHLPEEVKCQAGHAVERSREMIEHGKELIEKGSKLAAQGKEYLDEKKQTLSAAIEAGKQAMTKEKEELNRALGGDQG